MLIIPMRERKEQHKKPLKRFFFFRLIYYTQHKYSLFVCYFHFSGDHLTNRNDKKKYTKINNREFESEIESLKKIHEPLNRHEVLVRRYI